LDLLNEFDSIGTDHAPHTLEEKTKTTWTSAAGIPGLEATLPLLLTEVNKNKITLDEVVRLTSFNPSKIFKIPNKGLLKEGYDADITILDMKKEGKINVDEWFTQAKYSPFENRNYVGCNVMTINRGNIVCENNETIKHESKYVY
jgi:dihydroorotase